MPTGKMLQKPDPTVLSLQGTKSKLDGQWPLLGMTPWIGWQIWVSEWVVLIVDNCLAHPAIGGLTTIQLCFLPPNMTSVTQPVDPGVNRSLNEKYSSRVIQMTIKAIDFLKDIPKVSILDAMKLLTFSYILLLPTRQSKVVLQKQESRIMIN